MAVNFELPIDDVCKLLVDGIGTQLEDIIKKKLSEKIQPQVDAYISELARDLAANTKVAINGYRSLDPFDTTVVLLQFNNKDIEYKP
jgi:hypothetical protein